MKLILGSAGSGKTNKLAELAGPVDNLPLVILMEDDPSNFRKRIFSQGYVNDESFIYLIDDLSIEGILNKITKELDKLSIDVPVTIFIDNILPLNIEELERIKMLESDYENVKDVFITIQTNRVFNGLEVKDFTEVFN